MTINLTDAETFQILRETADNPALGDDYQPGNPPAQEWTQRFSIWLPAHRR